MVAMSHHTARGIRFQIIVDIAFEISDVAIDTHVFILKQSGAAIFVFAGASDVAVKVRRRTAELNWYPLFVLDDAAASIATALKPAGLENSAGAISTSFLKDCQRSGMEG